jgi:thiol-disulfide isomerase/thioredoxin
LPLILLLLLLLLGACDSGPRDTPPAPDPSAPEGQATGRLDRSNAGKLAPDLPFEGPDGRPATLADFRGKPLLVNLWATWCAPCIAEMPTLDRLAASEPGLKVLTLSQDLNGRDKVAAFFEQRKFAKLEPYLDPELKLMMELKVSTLPTTILYDRDGRELWRMTGIEEWTEERAKGLVAEALKP